MRTFLERIFAGCLLLAAWPPACPSARAETLTLADCLRETAASNPSIVAQQFGIQQAYGQQLVLHATALPSLALEGEAGYQGAQTTEVVRVPGQGNADNPRSSTVILAAGGQLTQPIFDAVIPPSWRLGTLEVTVAQQNLYMFATAALYRTRTLFDHALYYQRRDEFLHLTDQVLQGNLKAQNLLIAAGLGTRQGVLSAQVQRANFDPILTGNNGSYRSTLADLLQNMGRHIPPASGHADPLAGYTLAGSLDEGPLKFDPAAVEKEALDARPDLQALRTEMRIFTENANVARAGYYPNVKIYLAGQYLPQSYIQSQNASSRASDRVETTELRPGISGDWTIIDTGTILGQTRQLSALRGVIGQKLRDLEETIPGDLATLRGQSDAARQALTVLRGNVGTAQDTLNIIQAGVAQGVNSQLEFLDAQSGVFATQLGLLESQYALAQTHAEFDRVTGRYLRFVVPAKPAPRSRNAK